MYNVKFGIQNWNGTSDITYSDSCPGSSNLFGCISLRSKNYCILNKQYAKEEYHNLLLKIIKQMEEMPYTDNQGRLYTYGEFFPSELSLFAYNETSAYDHFPLEKEEAIRKGFLWKKQEEKDIKPTLLQDTLNNLHNIDDSILNEIIECSHQGECSDRCTIGFKIIKAELDFYNKIQLPIPKLCPNCRHYQRLKQRNPLKLWHRTCQCKGTTSENGIYQNTIKHFHEAEHCPNEFETSYAPDRPEIIYCEQCYQAEVV